MLVTEAVIHRLDKARDAHGEDAVTFNWANAPLMTTPLLVTMTERIIETYGSTANSHGSLGVDPHLHQFPIVLKAYLEGADFLGFTRTASTLIGGEMRKEPFATGGYALFLRYTTNGSDFLLVVMLKVRDEAGIDPDTMQLRDSFALNVNKIHEAARINLSRWAQHQEPYLTFIKAGRSSATISDYFRTALACENFTDSKKQTESVLKAVNAFYESRTDLSAEQRIEGRQGAKARLFDLFEANPTEVHLNAVSAHVFATEPSAFTEFVRMPANEQLFAINEHFSPHRQTYRKIMRISGRMQSGSVRVTFEVDDLDNGRVEYVAAENILVLHNPAPALVAQINDARAAAAPAD